VSRRRPNPYRRPDAHTRAARAAGYAARSVFKLEEIDRRARLLRPGERVLDLGAAPGSWSRYAAERIGPEGRLLAVDRRPLAQALPPWCHALEGDVLALGDALAAAGPYDVVLSDMAPDTSGDRATDQARSHALFEAALDVAERMLDPGGAFVGKLFMGPDFEAARARMRALFDEVRVMRPEAVRTRSTEVFLVGRGRRPAAR
jgi:23S rRNA (uridine2552-2'-O)-methyltransferase